MIKSSKIGNSELRIINKYAEPLRLFQDGKKGSIATLPKCINTIHIFNS